MALPEVDIQPGDSMQTAERKVIAALRAAGLDLDPIEGLNSHTPTAPHCHFHQGLHAGRLHVVCVMVGSWDETTVLAVLNILLNLRMDPDPPGMPPIFVFHSAEPVPPVLLGLFGNTPESDFECRAALVANFGNDLGPAHAFQLAAVAIHLLRECLQLRIDFFTAEGEVELGRSIVEAFSPERCPGAASPLNSLVVLGFLFGEMLRARLPHSTRWARIKDCAPWPALVVGAATGADEAGVPQLVFSPLASVIKAYELRGAGYLHDVALALATKCEEVLGPAPSPAPEPRPESAGRLESP